MASFTLTVLGAGPAAPNPGGACSGYLLREGDAAVLVDCGSGVAGRIPLHAPANRLTAVVISHFHPDHYFDLVQLYYLLRFGERHLDQPPLLPLLLPPGGHAFLRQFGELIGGRAEMLEDVYDMIDYEPEREFTVGSLRLTFHPVQHYVASHAVRAQAPDGAVLVFSSDVGPCEGLVAAAHEADLFLCESALLNPASDEPHPERRGHMSAAEAGAAATAARVKHLILTHYRSSDKYDHRHLEGARSTFHGPVELAREGQTYIVSG
jgi:ribonuclease BN (tRNA processing enzyme)